MKRLPVWSAKKSGPGFLKRLFGPVILMSLTVLLGGLMLWPVEQLSARGRTPFPMLQGAAASEHLKQLGLYGSLRAALAAQLSLSLTQQAKLSHIDIALSIGANDHLGYSIAISGDTVVVGVPRAGAPLASGNQESRGAVVVFVRSGASWVFQQAFLSSAPDFASYFGWSVAISGNTLVAGSIRENDFVRGGLHIFERSGGVWSETQRFLGEASESRGYAVAISEDGNRIVAGAPTYNSNRGALFVYERPGLGQSWAFQQRLTASDAAVEDYLGQAVAVSGDTLVGGAKWSDIGGQTNQGAVYVFARLGGTWTQQQKLIASDGAASNLFGDAVAISGETVA